MQQLIKKDDMQLLANKIKNRLDLDTITPSEMPEKIPLIGGSGGGGQPTGSDYYNALLENPSFLLASGTDYLVFDTTGTYILKNKSTLVLLEELDMTDITELVRTNTYILFASNRGVFTYTFSDYTFSTKALGDFSNGLVKRFIDNHYLFYSSSLSIGFYFNSNNLDFIIIGISSLSAGNLVIVKEFNNGSAFFYDGANATSYLFYYNIYNHTITPLSRSILYIINSTSTDYYIVGGTGGFYRLSDDTHEINKISTYTLSLSSYTYYYKYISNTNSIEFVPNNSTYNYIYYLDTNIVKQVSSYPTDRGTRYYGAFGTVICYNSSSASYPGLYYIDHVTGNWKLVTNSYIYLNAFGVFNMSPTEALLASTNATYKSLYKLTYIGTTMSLTLIDPDIYSITTRSVSQMGGSVDYNGNYGISLGNNKFYLRVTGKNGPIIYDNSNDTYQVIDTVTGLGGNGSNIYAHQESNLLLVGSSTSSYKGLLVYNLTDGTTTKVTSNGYGLCSAYTLTAPTITVIDGTTLKLSYTYFGLGLLNTSTITYTELIAANLPTVTKLSDRYDLYATLSKTSTSVMVFDSIDKVVRTFGTTINTYPFNYRKLISDNELICMSVNSSYKFIQYYNLSTGAYSQATYTSEIITGTTSYCSINAIDSTHILIPFASNTVSTNPLSAHIVTINDQSTITVGAVSTPVVPIYNGTSSKTIASYCNAAELSIINIGTNLKVIKNKNYAYLYETVNNTILYTSFDAENKVFEEIFENSNYYVYRLNNNYPSTIADDYQFVDYSSMTFAYDKVNNTNTLIGYGSYLKLNSGVVTFNGRIDTRYSGTSYSNIYRPTMYFNFTTGVLTELTFPTSASTTGSGIMTAVVPTSYNNFDGNKVIFRIIGYLQGGSAYTGDKYVYFDADEVVSTTHSCNATITVSVPGLINIDGINYSPVIIEKHLDNNYILISNAFKADKIIKFDLLLRQWSVYKIGIDPSTSVI